MMRTLDVGKDNQNKIKIVEATIEIYKRKLERANLAPELIQKYSDLIEVENENRKKLILKYSEECL